MMQRVYLAMALALLLATVVNCSDGENDSSQSGDGGVGGSSTSAGGGSGGSGGGQTATNNLTNNATSDDSTTTNSTTGGGSELMPLPGAEGFNCSPAEGDAPSLTLTEVASGFTDPLLVTYAPGDAGRLFVVEQAGRILVIENGVVESEPFLDIVGSVERQGDEQGLLGLAFHPDYAENGLFYVNYSARSGVHAAGPGDTIVSEFSVSDDPNKADSDSERLVLWVDQPYGNHNGGMVSFGPDGFLYIGMGDGGSGGDPDGNGQDIDTLLGSMLRIDVDSRDAGQYGIPSGNLPGGAPEAWDYGLRNPWRFSFDGCTGDLYIADVGQDDWEELNVVPRGQGHNNFGWNVREGAHCYRANNCDSAGMVEPITDYGHSVGLSITGGYVYRGSLVPGLRGTYLYADYVTGAFFAFEYVEGEMQNPRELTDELGTTNGLITSLGQDADGEVYVVRRYGAIQRIEAN